MGLSANRLHHNTRNLNAHPWQLHVWSNFGNRVTILQKLDENAEGRTLEYLLVKRAIAAVPSAVYLNSRTEQR